MKNEDTILINRIKDLAKASFSQNRYTFSNFLTLEEQALIYSNRSEINYIDFDFFGGHECCERKIIRFGSEKDLSYEEPYPISILLIEPLIDKFSDELNHRDFLGAIMNLGIQRNVLGDILIKGKKAYVFCLNDVADYIQSELSRVKHTSVKITKVEGPVDALERKLEDMEILVSSPRFDAVVAAICKLSRGKAAILFKESKILLNDRICENNSHLLKPGNSFSIRGTGKFIYVGEGGKTRKDRVFLHLKRYV